MREHREKRWETPWNRELSWVCSDMGWTGTGWGPSSLAFSWFIDIVTMVYDTDTYIFRWGYKPTCSWGAPSCLLAFRWEKWWPAIGSCEPPNSFQKWAAQQYQCRAKLNGSPGSPLFIKGGNGKFMGHSRKKSRFCMEKSSIHGACSVATLKKPEGLIGLAVFRWGLWMKDVTPRPNIDHITMCICVCMYLCMYVCMYVGR